MDTVHRADVVGSLIRPAALHRARAEFAAERLPNAGLLAAEDEAVRSVIALQRECGFGVVTDGEVRRSSYLAPLTDGLEGVTKIDGRTRTWTTADGRQEELPSPWVIAGRLALRDSIAVDEFRYANAVTAATVKITLPSPLSMLGRWDPTMSTRAYRDPLEMFRDCAGILRAIVDDLVELGARYIQFDAPELTAVVDPKSREELADYGLSESVLLDTACALMNDLATAKRPDVRFAVHLCRGNNKGRHRKSGGYERIASTVFEKIPNISTFMLEFDDERSGGFDALAGSVPADKTIVLGLVSTKLPALEDEAAILRRIDQAAEYVPADQLAVSTQCGFSSSAEGSPLDEAEQRQKLSLVADVARKYWG
jgi:5-methyltetrahydropteroyltriglutamate--homocysteine methyltransferase